MLPYNSISLSDMSGEDREMETLKQTGIAIKNFL